MAPIEMNGRVYLSTWAFLTETVDILQLCASGAVPNLSVHGNGMLADALKEFVMQQQAAIRQRQAAPLFSEESLLDGLGEFQGLGNMDDVPEEMRM